jgi:aldose sugar dehydrogenase
VTPLRRRLVAMVAGSTLGAVAPAAGQTLVDPALQVELVTGGLATPTSMVFIGPDDILVLQKNDGRVRRVLNGVLLPAAVLDLPVHFSSERGLLGIALDPDFGNTRKVVLDYTESPTGADTSSAGVTPAGNRLVRYTWDGTALVDPEPLLDLPATPGPNHNGGVILFGPDDALYAVIGDLNRNGRLENFPAGAAPDDTGAILRVDRSGRTLADGPFFDPAVPDAPLGHLFAYGVRNSFGLAFDPLTGRLWDTENGPTSYDEVNRVVPGMNSGWEQIMGPDDRDPQGPADLWMAPGAVYRDPEFSWVATVAPTSLAFADGPILGCGLMGDLLVADNNCGQLYRFRLDAARDHLVFVSSFLQDRVADNGGATCVAEQGEILFGGGFGVVTDLEPGPDGRLYVVSLSGGAIYRIGPRPGAVPDADGDGASDACDCAPGDPAAYAAPREIPRLRLGGATSASIGWDVQAASAGAGTTYTLVAGDTGLLRAQGGFASACTLAEGVSGGTFTDPLPDPAPGTARYVLAAARNTCGAATFGDGTPLPNPRDLLDGALPPACACAGRSGGAFVTFSIVAESLTVWVTDGPFIDRAQELLATGKVQIPVFGTLLDGADCDARWSWHPDPADVVFADAAIELCDGLPSAVEADKDYWINTVGSYCPWAAMVTAVDDRRQSL